MDALGYLKSKRLSLGLSLQEVASKADRSITLLKALEQGRFSEIGPPPLVRMHLLAYSRVLETDQFPSTQEQALQPPLAHPNPSNPPPPCTRLSSSRNALWGLVAFLSIGVLVVGMGYHMSQLSREARDYPKSQWSDPDTAPKPTSVYEPPAGLSTLPDANASIEELPTPAAPPILPSDARAEPISAEAAGRELRTAAPTGSAASEESVAPQPMSVPHRFEIEALQSSWVEVRVDGRKSEGVLLQPGDKRAWSVAEELQILVGNAGGIQMKWDDVPVDLDGRSGQVMRFRLPHAIISGKFR